MFCYKFRLHVFTVTRLMSYEDDLCLTQQYIYIVKVLYIHLSLEYSHIII